MKIIINEDIAKQQGLSLQEVMLVSLIKSGININNCLENLVDRQILIKDLFGNYTVLQKWAEVCDNVLLSSDSSIPSDSELTPLAEKLMALMPQCKKENTPYYFKCNKREVVLKLKKFFKLYGKYTEDEIIDATQKYVNSFNGDYTYMRLLKYFILKEERKMNVDGIVSVEETSTLATLLESKGDVYIPQNFDNGELV